MKCKQCGSTDSHSTNPDSYMNCEEKQVMIRSGVCFQCAFWICTVLRFKNDPLWIRVDGKSYHTSVVLKEGQRAVSQSHRTGFKGFGGSEFRVRFFDGREIRTDDLWSQGEMPDWVRDRFPDNAEFVK